VALVSKRLDACIQEYQYESMLQTKKSPLTEEQQRKLLDLWMAAIL